MNINYEAGSRHEEDTGMKSKSFTKIIKCLTLLGVIWILLGVGQLLATPADPVTDTKDGAMNFANTLEAKPAEIPPIDVAAPTIFETASFGLG